MNVAEGPGEVIDGCVESDASPDDIDEAKTVVMYFRCLEGSGTVLSDITDNKFDVEAILEHFHVKVSEGRLPAKDTQEGYLGRLPGKVTQGFKI